MRISAKDVVDVQAMLSLADATDEQRRFAARTLRELMIRCLSNSERQVYDYCLASDQDAWLVPEVARALDMPLQTVNQVFRNMHDAGFFIKDTIGDTPEKPRVRYRWKEDLL